MQSMQPLNLEMVEAYSILHYLSDAPLLPKLLTIRVVKTDLLPHPLPTTFHPNKRILSRPIFPTEKIPTTLFDTISYTHTITVHENHYGPNTPKTASITGLPENRSRGKCLLSNVIRRG